MLRPFTKFINRLLIKRGVLCSDGAAVYSTFAKKTGIAHEVIHTKGMRTRGVFHIQNVNAYGSRLKTWMRLFNRCGHQIFRALFMVSTATGA